MCSRDPFSGFSPISTCAMSHQSPRDKWHFGAFLSVASSPAVPPAAAPGWSRAGSVSHSDSIKRSESLTWLPPGSWRVICMIIQHEFAFVTEQGTAGGHGFCRARRAGRDEPQRVRARADTPDRVTPPVTQAAVTRTLCIWRGWSISCHRRQPSTDPRFPLPTSRRDTLAGQGSAAQADGSVPGSQHH